MHRRLDAVLDHAEVREEVELLEDHPCAQTQVADASLAFAPLFAERVGGDGDAVDLHQAIRWVLEEVEAAQESALPGSGATQDADRLPRPDGDRGAAKHVVLAEPLGDLRGLEHRLGARLHQHTRLLGGMQLVDVRALGLQVAAHPLLSLLRSPAASRFSMRFWKVLKMIVSAQ